MFLLNDNLFMIATLGGKGTLLQSSKIVIYQTLSSLEITEIMTTLDVTMKTLFKVNCSEKDYSV